MQTKVWQGVNRQNRALSGKKMENFIQFLEACCAAHKESNQYFTYASSLIKERQWVKLVELADYLASQTYSSANEHFMANQFALLIRKFPFPKELVNFKPEEKAISTFMAAEQKCSRQNRKMRLLRSGLFDPRKSRDYQYRLSSMRSYISYVLGCQLNMKHIADNCEYGAGASIGVHGNATNVARKLLTQPWTVSPGAFTLAAQIMWNHAQIRELVLSEKGRELYCLDLEKYREVFPKLCSIVTYNKISFVPKTVRTKRSIAVEPLLNGYLQKGIDSCMRKLLLRVGIDLRDQGKNQRMARLGSLDDSAESPCTIDLKSASDTLAREVVRDLLPTEWYSLLNATRSQEFLLKGKQKPYEKFCSMGNGFCFPLQSLIFAAAVNEAGGIIGFDSLVYGDDIIVPRRIFDRVIKNLKLLGFIPNREKTFSSGLFRESCGADWFGGEDVRPFTLDFELDSLGSVFKLHNLTKRNAKTTAFFSFLQGMTFGVAQRYWFVRPFPGPADSAIEVSLDEFMASPHAKFIPSQWGWSWLELLQSPVKDSGVGSMERYNVALVYGALRNSPSEKPFTMRRVSHTKVCRKTGSGATSSWLPAPEDQRA